MHNIVYVIGAASFFFTILIESVILLLGTDKEYRRIHQYTDIIIESAVLLAGCVL